VILVPQGPIGKAPASNDVGDWVSNELNETRLIIGDDQRRKAMTQTLTPPPDTAARPAADERCDRCNAAGKLRVKLAGGGELVFCGHHANKYADDLVKIAVEAAADPDFVWRGSEN
jgi:hypothetical protein